MAMLFLVRRQSLSGELHPNSSGDGASDSPSAGGKITFLKSLCICPTWPWRAFASAALCERDCLREIGSCRKNMRPEVRFSCS